MWKSTIASLVAAVVVVSVAAPGSNHFINALNNCGYQSCPVGDPDKLNVHIVSHSHWDVGRLATVDDYFYGGVQYIIDSVLDELEKDSNKRFIFAEAAFLWRWWTSRGWQSRQQFTELIQSGQLEIVGGGWSMNDEASTHYVEITDQMTWGLRFLNDTLGDCSRPRVAWQVDTFGHSREMASLLAQMGYDGVFLGRVDYEDKAEREHSKTMEFVWNASANLGSAGQIFGVIMPHIYHPPDGFCFDIFCSDDPIKDNPNIKGYNVDEKVETFLEMIKDQSQKYATNHLIVTMGDDFSHQSASTWFTNLDKLIKYVNAQQNNGSHVNVFYSTPSCYLQALNQADQTWSVKTDDFFPYASDRRSYFTGYYASRSALKRYIKYTNNILQVAKQLSAVARLDSDNEERLELLKRYQAEAQDHNAITGTASRHVVDDYVDSLVTAVSTVETVINHAYAKLMPKGVRPSPVQHFCHNLNISCCSITENANDSFAVTAYNPLAHTVRSHIRVPVIAKMYRVRGPDGNTMSSQMVPVPKPVKDNPNRKSKAHQELIFVYDLPPLGFTTFFIEPYTYENAENKSINEIALARAMPTNQTRDDLVIENEYVKATVDGESGLLKSVTNLLDNKTHSIRQDFYYYSALAAQSRDAGLHIFTPNGTKATPVNNGSTGINVTLIKGSEVQEIHQTFNNYVSQVIRIYKGEHGVEFEWQIGPIPIDDGVGKEIITRFDTNFDTRGYFYTDSNGREILNRQRNSRPTQQLNLSALAGNYYPITGITYIKDDLKDVQLTIATDRSQGVSSIEDGSLELMIHRRLVHREGSGPLDEQDFDDEDLVVRGKHRLLLTSLADAPQLHRAVSLMTNLPPVITITPIKTSVEKYMDNYHTSYSGLNGDFPGNVNLLTLEPWKDGTFLMRLEHYFETSDDPTGLSQPVTINLKNIFSPFTVTDVHETTLGANAWTNDVQRFHWKTDDRNSFLQNLEVFVPPTNADSNKHRYVWGRQGDDHLDVTLRPMQIRTFVVTVVEKHIM